MNANVYKVLCEVINQIKMDEYLYGKLLVDKGHVFKKLIKSYDIKVLNICYEKKTNGFMF